MRGLRFHVLTTVYISYHDQLRIGYYSVVRLSVYTKKNSFVLPTAQAVTAAQNESADQYAKAGGLATEMLSGVRTVTALNAQPEAVIRYTVSIL